MSIYWVKNKQIYKIRIYLSKYVLAWPSIVRCKKQKRSKQMVNDHWINRAFAHKNGRSCMHKCRAIPWLWYNNYLQLELFQYKTCQKLSKHYPRLTGVTKQIRYPDWTGNWKKNHLENDYWVSTPSLSKTTVVACTKVVPNHDYDTTVIYSWSFSNTKHVKS